MPKILGLQPSRRRRTVRRLYAFLLAFAEFERPIIRERLLVGIDRARDQGTQLGRRRLEDTDAKKVAASAEQPAWRSLLWYPARPPGGSGRSASPRRNAAS
jgi:hypothetical protein